MRGRLKSSMFRLTVDSCKTQSSSLDPGKLCLNVTSQLKRIDDDHLPFWRGKDGNLHTVCRKTRKPFPDPLMNLDWRRGRVYPRIDGHQARIWLMRPNGKHRRPCFVGSGNPAIGRSKTPYGLPIGHLPDEMRVPVRTIGFEYRSNFLFMKLLHRGLSLNGVLMSRPEGRSLFNQAGSNPGAELISVGL